MLAERVEIPLHLGLANAKKVSPLLLWLTDMQALSDAFEQAVRRCEGKHLLPC